MAMHPSARRTPTRSPKLAPYLVVHEARALLQFIESGLGGTHGVLVGEGDSGAVHHAEMIVEGSVVMVADAPEGRSPFPAMIHLYVADAAAAHARALKAGAVNVREPTLQPDGDRRGGVRDRWGNEWWFTQAAPLEK